MYWRKALLVAVCYTVYSSLFGGFYLIFMEAINRDDFKQSLENANLRYGDFMGIISLVFALLNMGVLFAITLLIMRTIRPKPNEDKADKIHYIM